MDQDRLDHLVELAREDFHRQENTRRAKDRLRTVLDMSPHHRSALELMGLIYYQHRDYRNAVMYWSRAGYWLNPMPDACEHVLKMTTKALTREESSTAKYFLYAFAGSTPPGVIGERLSILRKAHYALDRKLSKLPAIACTGGCLIATLAIIFTVIGASWSSFLWIAVLALISILIVSGINALAYARAVRQFKKAVELFSRNLPPLA